MLVLFIVAGGIYAGGLVALALGAVSAPIGDEGAAGFEESSASELTKPRDLPASGETGALLG